MGNVCFFGRVLSLQAIHLEYHPWIPLPSEHAFCSKRPQISVELAPNLSVETFIKLNIPGKKLFMSLGLGCFLNCAPKRYAVYRVCI